MQTDLKMLAVALLSAFAGQAMAAAETYKCPQPDGKSIYQNWPCGTKPEIEKKPPAKPDYPETVKCGMANGLAGTLAAIAGQKAASSDCGKR